MNVIKEINPNTDILIRGAKEITTRFPACLAKVLTVGKTFRVIMADRTRPMKGKVTVLKRVRGGIDVTLAISKGVRRRVSKTRSTR